MKIIKKLKSRVKKSRLLFNRRFLVISFILMMLLKVTGLASAAPVTPSAFSMSEVTGNVTTIITAAVGWMQTFLNFVIANPIILIFFFLTLAGFGIGLLKRLFGIFG
jgi:hypothetical protein